MADHRRRNVDVANGRFRIELLEGGSGPPLVYLHGARPFDGWTAYLDQLAGLYHVYAPYHPGIGNSQGLEHLDDVWDLVLFYDELLDSLKLDQPSLLGHSYGGMIAAELAAHNSQKVHRLVLVSSIGLWLDDAPVADVFVLSPEERAKATWYDPTSEAAKASMAQPDDPMARKEAELSVIEALASTGKFTWPIPDRGLRKRIHRINSPTLLLWGDSDGIVPPIYAEEFQRLIPDSTSVVLKNCGHIPQLERPQEFFEAVTGFLTAS